MWMRSQTNDVKPGQAAPARNPITSEAETSAAFPGFSFIPFLRLSDTRCGARWLARVTLAPVS